MDPQLLTKEQAARIAKLEVGDIVALTKLMSVGMRAGDAHEYAVKIDAGEEPEANLAPGAPRTLEIHAWSFLKDRGQYSSTYGMTGADAGRLIDLFESDPKAVVEQITEVVSKALRRKGSDRPVKVTLDGKPTAKVAPGSPPPTDDGGLRRLRAEIQTASGVYGGYTFPVSPTGRAGPQAFAVDLGGGLVAFGQSKALAIAAARICRVKGRHDELVKPYIFLVLKGASPRFADDIASSVWDGRMPSGGVPPAPPEVKAQTKA